MMPVRRLDRSNSSKRGWSSSAMNMVGTPYSEVQRSAWIVSSTASGSKASAGNDHAGAVGRAGQRGQHTAEGVIQRHRGAHAVVLGQSELLGREEGVVEDVVVRQRGALGGARGAGGVLDVDGSSNWSAASRSAKLGSVDVLATGKQRSQSSSSTSACAAPDSGADFLEHRHVVGLAEAARQQQQADAGLLQGVLQLGGLVGGVDVDQDGANARSGVLEHDPLIAIGRPDADAVALLDAVREQPARAARGQLPQLW